MTNVLVTGGAGFVGSHIVDELVASGYDVTVVDNLTEQVHDDEPDYLNDEAEYVWGDVRDRELMTELLEEADVLNHQASAVGVGQSMYEIEKYVEVNTLATARILDIIVNEDISLEKIVVASSMSIYGEGAYHCPEEDTLHYPSLRGSETMAEGQWEHVCPDCGTELEPIATSEKKPRESTSVYAISKKDQEELTLSVARSYDIPAVALRYFNIYGSRQALGNPYTGVCAIFSSRIKNDNPPLIFEDGEQTRDFIHISDIARANRLAMERDEAEDVALNLGTGNPKTITEIAETLIDLYGKSDELEPEIANDFRQGDIRHCYADTSRAAELLDFKPSVTFEEGMRELVEWGREQDAQDNFEEAHAELEDKGLVGDN
ncbi:nucleoside-diphosphate-sugar epimerase [Halogeometricum borinquense DSM 11551]|uniref:Nucleoside-diphosphate-sugar epimerase n=1 Tax=Halogeometricum borinquense (strain ATCC 700274 / DSM 11551 / JCM 10706 / KCTC 4070 / PR3) TaxID=469382 RepID=E4NM65_HALBP|nr:SDR family NAD(P)-dependent oxidoreductase [Halogeometricum borinquense]ADQ67270.1 nucleoside-diphosphate-sugar epimerase [Halogeometricum borinquense DSM 11551]ELY28486.1 nucleoside-diphosphate-sugar epimerase [Halogeometricum borinquense DSM 11551]